MPSAAQDLELLRQLNPEAAREVEALAARLQEDPELGRGLVAAFTQYLEQNPEVAQMLAHPELLEQNPEALQQVEALAAQLQAQDPEAAQQAEALVAQVLQQNPEAAQQAEALAAQVLQQNPELAQELAQARARCSCQPFSGLQSACLRALGTATLLIMVPYLKGLTHSMGAAYLGAAMGGQVVAAAISKGAPDGSQELTVAPELAGRLKLSKATVMILSYFGAISGGNELPKQVPSDALLATRLALSLAVGLVIQLLPFGLVRLSGGEVGERNLTRNSNAVIALSMLMAGAFGAAGGGVVDGATAATKNYPDSFNEQTSAALFYTSVLAGVVLFSTLQVYGTPIIQGALSGRAAARAQANAAPALDNAAPAPNNADAALDNAAAAPNNAAAQQHLANV